MSQMEEALLQSEASAKPYLVRALCEWCADKGLTPYLVVRVNDDTQVPMDYVSEEGDIVFNLSARTTHQLNIGNEWIMFSARFDGVSQEIVIPLSAVAAVFAKETGYGLYFSTFSAPSASGASETSSSPQEGKESKSHLKLVE